MRWLKAIIILTWLSVPIVGAISLYVDHQAYILANSSQQQACQDRLRWLAGYNQQIGYLATELDNAGELEALNSWRIDINDFNRRMYRDALKLNTGPLDLFPLTAQALMSQEAQLAEVKTTLEGVADDRAYLIRVNEQLDVLANQIDNLELSALYYQSIGAEGIYFKIQEELAVQEGSFNRQLRGRRSLLVSMSRHLREAIRLQAETADELESIGQLLAEDEKRTYRSNLKRRLSQFDLRARLHKLVYGTNLNSNTATRQRPNVRYQST